MMRPGAGCGPGRQGLAVEMRQAAAGRTTGRVGHRRPRGKEGTLSQPGLMRAEHRNPVRVRAAAGGVAGRL
jgi:hypothetical protein